MPTKIFFLILCTLWIYGCGKLIEPRGLRAPAALRQAPTPIPSPTPSSTPSPFPFPFLFPTPPPTPSSMPSPPPSGGELPTSWVKTFGIISHNMSWNATETNLYKNLGSPPIRIDMFWNSVESQKGQYNFAQYDTLYNQITAMGANVMFILCYNNSLYSGSSNDKQGISTEANRQAFVNFAMAAMTHFAGKGILWEIWNEPDNSVFWKPAPNANDYTALVIAVGKAVQSFFPNEKIMGPAIAFTGNSTGMAFLTTCLKAGALNYWSAVTVHFYPGTQLPEVGANVYPGVRTLIDQYSSEHIPLIVDETGISSGWLNGDENLQGVYLPRVLLSVLINGGDAAYVYDWKDDVSASPDFEKHFGIIHSDLSLKPAYSSTQDLIKQIGGRTFVRRIEMGTNNDYVVEFSGKRFAAWTTGGAHVVSIAGQSVSLTGKVMYGDLP